MTAPGTRYPPGSLVRCREREWVVLPPDDEDVLLLRPLAGDEAETAGVYLPLVRQGVETVAPATFPPPDPARRGDLAAAQLLWDAARLALRDGAGPFRSLGRLSVRPRAYQYVPLLLALRLDPVRMLIADDVGIGKTIEAALVARELLARGEIRRVCVLCPPYLADQWREELATKFHLSAEVVRSATAAGLERRLPPGADSIFAHYRHLVVSIDYAKSDHHRHAFLAHCADFVIVDEAHGAAAGGGKARTQRHELVASVARDPKRHLLLLTATPHSGFEAAFRSLLALVDPALGELDVANLTADERGQLARYFVQRRRADVADWVDVTAFPRRLSVEEPYSLSGEYKSLFRDVYAFAHELIKSGEGEEPWHRRLRHWTALALLRCVMSSPASAIASLEARLGRSGGHAITPSEEDAAAEALDAAATPMVLEPSNVEAATDVSPGGLLAAGEMDLGRGERRRLRDLARRAQELAGTGADAKLAKVIEVVDGLLADAVSSPPATTWPPPSRSTWASGAPCG
ncbi:MAG: DEAD/DEAH box helicase [Anaerolineae bacterium]